MRCVLPETQELLAWRGTSVDIVIPVLNEERALPWAVRTLSEYLNDALQLPWRITIVDNGSTDSTWALASELADAIPGVFAMRIDRRGKGAAVKEAWRRSPADVVAFLDVDLSTGLHALPPLVIAVVAGHCEVAIGTRLANGSRTRRGLKRELISRAYNGLLRVGFGARFTDATCGFKAARAEIVRPLLERVEDESWFFDTELLLLAQHNGVRIREVPVDWVEDEDSQVNVWATALSNLRGLLRVAMTIASGAARVELPPIPELRQPYPPRVRKRNGLVAFCLIGSIATCVHVLLYCVLRQGCTSVVANLLALSATTVASVEAHRRWTFNQAERARLPVHSRALLLFCLTYLVTGTGLWLTTVAGLGLSLLGECGVLVIAAAAVTLLRMSLMRRWVFASS